MEKLTNELGLTAADLERHELTDADIAQVTGGVGSEDSVEMPAETTIIRGNDGTSTTIIRGGDTATLQ